MFLSSDLTLFISTLVMNLPGQQEQILEQKATGTTLVLEVARLYHLSCGGVESQTVE